MKKSELRQDLASGDWILIAPQRGRRAHAFLKKKRRLRAPLKNCPFENILEKQKPIFLYDGEGKDWAVAILENKYPAVAHARVCAVRSREGPYSRFTGIGHHDLVVTRDHNRNFANLSQEEANQVFQVFRDRYLMLLDDSCLAYISVFQNWGPSAGATIYHPHYQLLAIPVVPPEVKQSLFGAWRYFKKYKSCVHCAMIKYEKQERKRIVYENKGAIAFTPFASREPFELRVFPKKHSPYFENTLDFDLARVMEVLQFSLKKIEKNLGDPDYNFFIHTAPIKDKKKYQNYHWHIEVLPKTNISAGFELSTGVEINIVDPDEAARILRSRT